MSKQKNVHPDHYKTEGSLRQGEDIVQSEHRKKLAEARAKREHPQDRAAEEGHDGANEDEGEDG